jgi:hypothetical protein
MRPSALDSAPAVPPATTTSAATKPDTASPDVKVKVTGRLTRPGASSVMVAVGMAVPWSWVAGAAAMLALPAASQVRPN